MLGLGGGSLGCGRAPRRLFWFVWLLALDFNLSPFAISLLGGFLYFIRRLFCAIVRAKVTKTYPGLTPLLLALSLLLRMDNCQPFVHGHSVVALGQKV